MQPSRDAPPGAPTPAVDHHSHALWGALHQVLHTGKLDWASLSHSVPMVTVLVTNSQFAVTNGIRARQGLLAEHLPWRPGDVVGADVLVECAPHVAPWKTQLTLATSSRPNDARAVHVKPVSDDVTLVALLTRRPVLVLMPSFEADVVIERWTGMLDAMGLASAVAPTPPLTAAQSNRRLLIADDDPLLARALKRGLRGHFDIDVAENGAAALEHLQCHRYDVVLCDLTMPDLTGVEVFERAQNADAAHGDAFVFMTGGVLRESTTAFLSTVANPIVDKPFDLKELRELLLTHAGRDVDANTA